MDDMNTDVLRQHFSSLLEDNRESGWEEQTDAALQHLLRTSTALLGPCRWSKQH